MEARHASIYSIGWASGGDRPTGLFANPQPGTRMSLWAEHNVIPKIANQPKVSERQALSSFLNVLKTNSGKTLSGWNIGYDMKPQGQAIGSGFDIPFLLSRSQRYGMQKEYSAAFKAMRIRDIAHETLFQLAPIVVKHGEHVDPEMLAQMKPFAWAAQTIRSQLESRGIHGDDLIQLGARRLYESNMSVAGWKLEQMHSLMGLGQFTAHDALADIAATRNIFLHGAVQDSPEFIKEWNRGALVNRLLKASEYGSFNPADRETHFSGLLARADKWSVRDLFLSRLKERGLDTPDVRKGIGVNLRAWKYIPDKEEMAARAVRIAKQTKWSKVKKPLGFAAAVVGLWALKPLSWFSGKDDEYNTIEGLRHGGAAEKKRKQTTDFGSGVQAMFGGTKALLQMPRSKVFSRIAKYIRSTSYVGNVLAAAGAATFESQVGVRGIFQFNKRLFRQSTRKLFNETFSSIELKQLAPLVIGHEASEVAHAISNVKTYIPLEQARLNNQFLGKIKNFFGIKNKINSSVGKQMGLIGSSPTFGSHISSGVIADEMLISAKLGSFNLMKKYRMAELDYLEKNQPEIYQGYIARTKKMYSSFEKKWLPKFSGQDDAYNTIEGLRHGGIAEQLRKAMTEFGSGWDKLRALVGTKTEKEFSRFIGSKGFQEALRTGKEIKELGAGAFGVAHLMETKVQVGGLNIFGKQIIKPREETFQYVRKQITKSDAKWKDVFHEAKAMRKLQDLNAPSLYGLKTITEEIHPGMRKLFPKIKPKKNYELYMEYFGGKEAGRAVLQGEQLPASFIADLKNHVSKMHERGITHGDLSRDVSKFLENDTQAMGEFIPHNIMLTKEGRAGVIDYGVSSSASSPMSPTQRGIMEQLGRANFSTIQEFDIALVNSLERNQGKLSVEAATKRTTYINRMKELQSMMKELQSNNLAAANNKLADSVATPQANKAKAAQRANIQRQVVAQNFENARSGGKRSRSTFAASSAVATKR